MAGERRPEHAFAYPKRPAVNGFTSSSRSAEHGFTSSRRSAEHGFTLVEVMISLFIFAMIAAAGVALLSFSVRAQAGSEAKLDGTAATERLAALLSADLAQAVVRPARNEAGDMVPAFTGAADGGTTPVLRLVRAGWSNPEEQPRAGLQKVEYRLENGGLARVAYPMVDGAPALPPAVLVDHVRQISLRYRIGGAWSDRWDGTPAAPLPQAVELDIVRENGVATRQLFLVGTGYAPFAATPAAAGNATAEATGGE